MASFERRDTHIKLDSRLYIPIESEPSFKCWLAVVNVVRLAGSLTTTDLSHLELVLAFDHAEDDDIWVQGFVKYELRHDFEDLVECEAVSYRHLTLPTNREVTISVVPLYFIKH